MLVQGGFAQVAVPRAQPVWLEMKVTETGLNAVGTGPFKFSEWIKDERFVAVRNDDYWGDKAYLDKVDRITDSALLSAYNESYKGN